MNPFDLGIRIEQGYQRQSLFALEVLDAVTLERVSDGITVSAAGLSRRPLVSWSGLFVWLLEGNAQPQGLEIDPGKRPLEGTTLGAGDITLPFTSVELAPRREYPFTRGVTGVRGMLVESQVLPPARPVPVAGARLQLRWLDEDATTWHDAPAPTRTDAAGGFAALLRIASADVPHVDAAGAFTVRLRASRDGSTRDSLPFSLPPGRVADTLPPFAWDELQP